MRQSSARWFLGLLAAGMLVLVAGCSTTSAADKATSVQQHLDKALRAHTAGQLDAAMSEYAAVLKLDATNRFAEYNLGLIAQTQGDMATAEKDYRLALQTDPNFVAALFNLAIVRTQAGAVEEGVSLYRRALAADPGNAGANLNLGLLLIQQGNATEGNQLVALAAQLNRLAPKRQAALHVALLALSLLALPITPGAPWKPQGDENPTWRILGLLALTIGLPYFLLSTTSPLLQAWFARRFHHAMPYRLFALSNLASLLALLAYPVLIEPWVSTVTQSIAWSVCYALFVLLCGYAAVASARAATADGAAAPVAVAGGAAEAPPSGAQRLTWLALAAMPSFLLLAVTNHICQNVASLPFLWILPLSLYLVTFIFCFDNPRWYHRNVFLVLAAGLLPAMAWYSDSLRLKLVIPMYLTGLFVCCMFCHGELARLKPVPRYLTTYYLMISLGGAVGGLLIGLVAPYVLTGYFELAIGLIACALLLLYRTARMGRWATLASAAVVGGTAWGAVKAVEYEVTDSRVMMRNFYSVVRTRESVGSFPFRSMVHGGIMHGGQLRDPELRFRPSSYFGPTSGFGRLFASLPAGPRKVGVIGLGAGSIIAYARRGDTFRFYEINPQVVELAKREFTFLTDSPAKIEVVLGDGRLSLAREPSKQFDVLAMDAFSGDSIPLHLLTREAMVIYLRHLKPGGVLAFQATNRFVDIAPVVASLAAEHGLTAVLVSDLRESTEGADYWLSATDQILVTSNRALLDSEGIRDGGSILEVPAGFRVWTDDFNNLLRVLK